MNEKKEQIIVDGSSMIFGRLATKIAKKLLEGHEVFLVNAEKIVIRGSPAQIGERYLTKRRLRQKGTPERSPVWSKVPHMLVKRMIRGMLPNENSRGRAALKRLKVYTGNPQNLKMNLQVEEAVFDGKTKHVKIHDLCKTIGYVG